MASSKNGFFSRNCFVILVISFLCLKRTFCLLQGYVHSQYWHLLRTVCERTSCSICVGFVQDILLILVFHTFFLFLICFISAGKAVRVVSGVNLFLFLFFLIRLVKHLLFSSYKKPHSSKNIYDFVFTFFVCLFCYASLLGFGCVLY